MDLDHGHLDAQDELAVRASVSLETFADFPHVSAPGLPDYWEDSYLPFYTRRGRPIERGRTVVTGADDLITMVGMGEVVHGFPSHVTRYWGMPNIWWLPVLDMPPLAFARCGEPMPKPTSSAHSPLPFAISAC
ncbi:hypothetical protein [Actinacidiphila paucisporea]|uniref:Uncharacterized protein n=1 Tax=Actinacidiphila paucisporea TaxID=310782 RepID=A0A1M7CJG3_9ACTN|nr:hypothetical protein [Actinacidiphila paucisporea]SHL67344.1 hypothetical protein SAMN05216499_105258 [Actinacidiphila paucisporea]